MMPNNISITILFIFSPLLSFVCRAAYEHMTHPHVTGVSALSWCRSPCYAQATGAFSIPYLIWMGNTRLMPGD